MDRPSEALFSNAGLSQNQQGCIAGDHSLDNIHKSFHGGAR